MKAYNVNEIKPPRDFFKFVLEIVIIAIISSSSHYHVLIFYEFR